MVVSFLPILGRRSKESPTHGVAPARAERLFVLAVIATLLLAAVAGAQTNIGAELRVDTDLPGTASSSLPQMVGTNDGSLHIVWQDYRGPQWGIYYRRAENLGTGFTGPEVPINIAQVPPSVAANATAPRVATDGSLAIYAVWHEALDGVEHIAFARSTDGGLSWGPPAPLVDSITGLGVSSEYAGRPQIAADGQGRVHVTWAQSDGERDQIYYAVSHDQGATFRVPPIGQPVNILMLGHSEDPRVATDGRGHVYVAWLDHREPPYRDVWIRHSTDFGQNWEPGEKRLSAHGVQIELNLLAHAATVGDFELEHRALAAWISLEENSNGIPLTTLNSRYSKDGGATWQTHEGSLSNRHPTVAGSGNKAGGGLGALAPGGAVPSPGSGGQLGKGDPPGARSNLPTVDQSIDIAFHLDVAVDGSGNAHAVHGRVDWPLVGRPTTVYYNRLDGDSGVWGVERAISRGGSPYPEHGLPTFARPHVSTSAGGAAVYATWTGAAPGVGQRTEVYGAYSKDGGVSWAPPVILSADPAGPGAARSAYPQIHARGARAAVVWDDRRNWTDHSVLPLPPDVPVGAPDVYLTSFGPQ